VLNVTLAPLSRSPGSSDAELFLELQALTLTDKVTSPARIARDMVSLLISF
jgi:hypothetical protein